MTQFRDKTSPFHALVSVIVPTFNQANFLSQALDSVLNQTYRTFELIIVDDGSTDETASLGADYRQKDPRIVWLEQPNQGPSQARNQALAIASGKFICFLDSDDRMHPNRLALQLQAFQDDPSIDIVYTALQMIDTHGAHIGEMRGHDYPKADFLARMLFRNLIPTTSAVMARQRCFKNNTFRTDFKHAEDYELHLRLAHEYRFKYLDIPLTDYRRHGENLSNNLAAHRQAEIAVLNRYSTEEIEEIINQTTFSSEEKLLLKGRIAFNQERWENALAEFSQLSSGLALFYTGNCYLRLTESAKAIDAYRRSLSADPTNPAAWNNLGAAYAQEKHLEQAKKCFNQATLLKAGYIDAQMNLRYAEMGAFDKEWRFTWRELRQHLMPYT